MRAYVAVLKDSFREALASRVLWIAIIGIILVLAGLAPFGISTDKAIELRRREMVNGELFLTNLYEKREAQGTPEAHIWSLLDEQQQERVRAASADEQETKDSERRPQRGGFNAVQRETVDDLNTLLQMPDFYDPASWDSVELNEEVEALIASEATDQASISRRNLLLLIAAFPKSIRVRDSNALTLKYAGATVVGPMEIPPSQFETAVEAGLEVVIALVLGFFGIFASLLVTSGMIPRTFEPGEISLLLSKPVSRALLFLTKFFGGCVFTFLCASLLIGGSWLLLGVRLGIWQHNLLACIPVYVFLFAIYYSVSALSGAIWRNAIVSVVLVVVFWIGLTTVGTVRQFIDENVVKARQITEIVVAGDDILTVSGSRKVQIWDEATGDWTEIFRQTDGPAIPAMLQRYAFSGSRFRPVFDHMNQRILALDAPPGQMAAFSSAKLVSGSKVDLWEREQEGQVPSPVSGLYVTTNGQTILPGQSAIYRFTGQTQKEKQTQQFLNNLFGVALGSGGKSGFERIEPEGMPAMTPPFVTAMDVETTELVYFADGVVHVFEQNPEGTFRFVTSRDLEIDEPCTLAISGGHISCAFGDGRLMVLNAATLETELEDRLAKGVLPHRMEAAPDGTSHTLLTHDQTLWIVDVAAGKPISWKPPEDGRCTGIAYDSIGNLLVSDGRVSVRSYDVATGKEIASYNGTEDWVFKVFDYVVSPLYTVLPKPAELDNLVHYMLTGQKSVSVNENQRPVIGRNKLEEERVSFDPWAPLRHNTLFLAVILGFGCLYVARRDF